MNRKVTTSVREVALSFAAGVSVSVVTSFWLLHASQSTDNFFAAIALLVIPLLVVEVATYIANLAPGSVCGTVLGFSALCLLETYYEQRIYQGPNSMPGFAIIIWCAPAALAALFLLYLCQLRWRFRRPTLNFVLAFLFVFAAPLGIALLSSVVH